MRTGVLRGTIAVLGLAFAGTQAFAVSGSIQVEIPFEFVIGDKVLPPARYIIDVASVTGPSVLTIREMESGKPLMFDTDQMPEKADPKAMELVFDTVGNTTYLTEVWGVVDSGRAVKHLVDGHPVERVAEAQRQHIAATRVVDRKDKKGARD